MKAVILAGGLGTRLREETMIRPKPMIEIGGLPILWHIMKLYAHHGICEFIICLGYKGHLIKEFFANYHLRTSDITVDLAAGTIEHGRSSSENWRVTLLDTGADTMTGGRIKRVRQRLGDEPFFLTYGDGVSDVDLSQLLEFHRAEGRLVTVTAVVPQNRFGKLVLTGNRVAAFREKDPDGDASVNGGFFVVSPKAIDYIDDDATVWEREPLETLAREGQLSGYRHDGFWHAIDTMHDRNFLEQLWEEGKAPWKVW